MADTLPDFQLFAITLLLSTPSELHNIWIAQNRDFDTFVAGALDQLGFSPAAIAAAKLQIDQPLKTKADLRNAFASMRATLKSSFAFYDPAGGAHPLPGQAKTIVDALRGKDESSSV
jgi:hypothetical protein